MTRLTPALCLLVLAAACGPYSYVKKAETNPMAGQTIFMQGSLVFSDCDVNGQREDAWVAGESDSWREDWGRGQRQAAVEFARSLQEQLRAKGIQLTPQGNPQGATYAIVPRVKKVETGRVVVVVSVKLTDASGTVLEEISTKGKSRGGSTRFEDQLASASVVTAGNIAGWVSERVGK